MVDKKLFVEVEGVDKTQPVIKGLDTLIKGMNAAKLSGKELVTATTSAQKNPPSMLR